MTLVLRILALTGSLAHVVDRLVGRLLGFLPFRVPGAVIVALLLCAAAWGSAQETTRAIADRPSPVETSVGALVDNPSSAWISVSGLLSGPHLDSSIYTTDRGANYIRISNDPHDHVREGGGEHVTEPDGQRPLIFALTPGDGVTRWFYVLRDPKAADRALVVRSARNGDQIRTRSVVVTATGTLDGRPHLVEVSDARSELAAASVVEVPDGAGTIVRGTFIDGTEVACDGGDACRDGRTWRYLLTDTAEPGASAWIDSPHPPDALPVTLVGVIATDATRMGIVLATDEMEAALDGLRHPSGQVLADGIGPMVPEVSYLGAVVLAAIGVLLLVSAAIRYPLFWRSAPRRLGEQLPRPVVDELIPVDVAGGLSVAGRTERLSGPPARIGWLPARELARRAWHLHSAAVSAPASDRPSLALLAIEGSFVLPIEPVRPRLLVEPGLLATSAAVRPGLRLSGPGLRLTLGFDSEDDRHRVQRELVSETDAPPVGPIPESVVPPARRLNPWARTAAAMAIAATGALVAAGSILGLVASDAAPVGAAGSVFAAAGLWLLAVGIARRHSLADELLPSVAVLGIVVTALVLLASGGCGSWLTPNLAGCESVEPIGLVPPLAGLATFVLCLWAVPHLSASAA